MLNFGFEILLCDLKVRWGSLVFKFVLATFMLVGLCVQCSHTTRFDGFTFVVYWIGRVELCIALV